MYKYTNFKRWDQDQVFLQIGPIIFHSISSHSDRNRNIETVFLIWEQNF